MQRLQCIFSALLLALSSNFVHSAEQMNWSINHWPPMMILEGEDKGQGRYDVFLELFQKNMPQYTHNTVDMNWARVWSDIAAGKEICNILALKNAKREEIALFSNPANITLSNRIILKKSTYEELGRPNTLSLKALVNHASLVGTLESSRSYTADLDRIIDARNKDSKVDKLTTNSVQLIKMLLAGRFDYMIEYPFITTFLLKSMKEPNTLINSVQIEEIAPFAPVHLACPKTAWGAARIAAFDQALDKIKDTPKYLEIMQMWYASEQEREAVREGYKTLRNSI